MRHVWFGLALALVAGCDDEPEMFQHAGRAIVGSTTRAELGSAATGAPIAGVAIYYCDGGDCDSRAPDLIAVTGVDGSWPPNLLPLDTDVPSSALRAVAPDGRQLDFSFSTPDAAAERDVYSLYVTFELGPSGAAWRDRLARPSP